MASSAPTSDLWCLLQSLARSMVGIVLAQQHFEGAGAEVATQLVACSTVTHRQQDAGCTDHSRHDQDQWKVEAGKKLKAGETVILLGDR